MIEIGERAPDFRGEGSTVKGIVEELKYNKIIILSPGAFLDLGNANETKNLGIVPFNRWRVIGMGIYWIEGSTADEDPIVEFGRSGDNNAFGTMTSAITGGERFSQYDRQKYDPLGLLAPEQITETSATLVVTWTEGIKFNIWQTSTLNIIAVEAAVAGMTTGQIFPYIIIEIDTRGRW